jgi:hypothetical protein
LGKVLLPLFLACLPDRGQDVIRGHETLVKLHLEKSGVLVIFYPDYPWNIFNLGAHGVRTTCSHKAAPFFHAVHLNGDRRGKILFSHGIAPSPVCPTLTTQCRAGL